jgi:hypothetical protein
MARPRKAGALDPFSDLNRKAEILEREMSMQREAMERLKQLAGTRAHPSAVPPADKTSRQKPASTLPR